MNCEAATMLSRPCGRSAITRVNLGIYCTQHGRAEAERLRRLGETPYVESLRRGP